MVNSNKNQSAYAPNVAPLLLNVWLRIMKLVTYTLFILALALSGCVTDITQYAPYDQYASHTVTLVKPMNLWKMEEHQYKFYPHSLIPTNWDMNSAGVLVTTLPKGSPLRITHVKRFYGLDVNTIEALGELKIDEISDPITFEYLWAISDSLSRAPWEGEVVPKKRFVGWHGTDYKPQNQDPITNRNSK